MNPSVDQMTSIWREVLAPAQVGPHSDFFASGGSSLSASRIVARITREFGCPVRVRNVLAHPSPAKLAAALRGADTVDTGAAAAEGAEPDLAFEGAVPLSSQQAAIWFMECLNPAGRGYNCVTTVRVPEQLDPVRLRAALQRVVDNNEALRTSFPISEGQPVQIVAEQAEADLRVRGRISADALRAEVLELSETPFDVSSLPLIFWVLYDDPDSEGSVLAQVEHHFVHDGWSTWLILHQIAQAYRGDEAAPTPAEVSYRAFTTRQQRWLGGTEAATQRTYWAQQLAGEHDQARFRDDAQRPPVFSHHGATIRTDLTQASAARVSSAVSSLGVTAFSILYSAFGILIGTETAADDLVIGTSYRNRRPEFEQTVGMFVNTLGLRFPSWRERTFREVAREAAELLADGHDHQEIPLADVVRELGMRPLLTRNPLFQVCMSMNDRPEQHLDFGDAGETYEVDFTAGGAKFDLDIVVVPPNDQRTWSLMWRYYSDVLSRQEVEGLIATFERVLELCVESPDTPIAELLAHADAVV